MKSAPRAAPVIYRQRAVFNVVGTRIAPALNIVAQQGVVALVKRMEIVLKGSVILNLGAVWSA